MPHRRKAADGLLIADEWIPDIAARSAPGRRPAAGGGPGDRAPLHRVVCRRDGGVGILLQSWIGSREVVEFDHCPDNDIVDTRHGSQFCYHAHRDGELEHGHLHLFWHATASGRRRYLRPGRPRWSRTAPSHLFAISLDARGLPVALFTVNRWVTEGHWFDAATTMSLVDRFALDGIDDHSCRWLARRAVRDSALRDHRLEVLSTPLDWAADLDALEAEGPRRGS
ncbi:MAG: hypothetical protein KGL18_02490 [Burkholderiales bacterium]|nr:hypothetical protein [Burkholderiales bacterium]MDE1926160.1 hypothetical protein [Burkholderiales bacterium]MDE2158047.1 hypothetical protein [Burkholderiales bacterium]MDE2501836.1 hypothetical protein [Burkholderiales bacterium]